MKLSILTFITSLAIAAVAAWYSIIGLTTIFSAAVVPIIIMGVVLEIGKLVAAAWVYQNWKETNVLLKSYLVSAIVVLMLITSMGIYGFLSKSHIDAGINTTEISVKLERLDNRINGEQRQIWSHLRDLNPRPIVYKTIALPTELRWLFVYKLYKIHDSQSNRGFLTF